jgi:hypothetical protein
MNTKLKWGEKIKKLYFDKNKQKPIHLKKTITFHQIETLESILQNCWGKNNYGQFYFIKTLP